MNTCPSQNHVTEKGYHTTMQHKNSILTLAGIVFLAVALVLGGSAASLTHNSAEASPPAQDDGQTRTITVTGYGSSFGSPDIAYISLGVEVNNPDIATAVNEVDSRMSEVISTLQNEGIAEDDIRTEFYNIYQERNYGPAGAEPTSSTFRASHIIRVTSRNVDQIGNLLSIAISAGANVVNNVSFDISDRGALQAEARSNALVDARDRAEQLASDLGVQISEVVSVREGSTGNIPVEAAMGLGGGGGGGIQGGPLEVTIALTITYAVQ